MKRIINTCTAAVLAVIFILTGCTSSMHTVPRRDADALRSYFLAETDAVEITDNSVIFTDASGEIREIGKNPEHVICLNASLTTLWYEAGGEVTGCIGSRSTIELYYEFIGRDITTDPCMIVVSASAAAKNWDVESIIALEPSLILCSTAMNGYGTIKGPAEAAGIPVIAAEYNDFRDYLKWFKVFTELCGHTELWDTVALPVLDGVIELIMSRPDDADVKVLSVFADSDSLSANTSGTVVGEMISLLGGVNIADPENTGHAERIEINLESVYAADPDVILVQCHTDTATAVSQIEELYGDNPVWNSLRAVKEGRVHYLEKSLFHSKPNSRFGEAYRALVGIMYPDND